MCKCTPEIRTPFCGRGDCLPPGYALAYEAAAAIEPVRHAHKAKVLAALAQHPGAIASELAEVVGFDPVETRRRLTDLKLGGHAYQAHTGVGPSGRRECRWWPRETQKALL